MLAHQRQEVIIEQLHQTGAVRVADLTELLGVSDMTIRRDLDQLVATGVARKVHGGAVSARRAAHEPGFAAKRQLEQTAKAAIAAAAVKLIQPGAAIAISAGTTTWHLARLIVSIPGLTIVTNSTAVADAVAALDAHERVSVILTGGVRTPSAALVGPVADRTIASMHVDQLFLGVHGMDAEAGFTTPNLAEAATNQGFIAAARELIVLADSSKWGVVGLANIAPLSAAHTVITNDNVPQDALALLGEAGPSVIAVHPDMSLGT
jgi:DeoR/GlpR family transcriptional regulator of sugar metabolism